MEDLQTLAQNALYALPQPPGIEDWLQTQGLQRVEMGLLFRAHLLEAPFTPDSLRAWAPYASPDLVGSRLQDLLDLGCLQAVEDGGYIVTDKGLGLVQEWAERIRAHLTTLTPLAPRELSRLATLLRRVVQAALVAPPPPHKDRLQAGQKIAPSADAAPMAQIDQYLTDLNMLRDDAHVAAWQEHGFEGPSIEALTLLWRGEAHNADGLSTALAERRGYAGPDYTRVVDGLAERGWLDASAPELTLTPEGLAQREQVETTTNRYFSFIWTVLKPVELQDLADLLQRFTQALKA